MHGGNIQAASAGAGCGSTFTVSLPLVTTRAAVTATEAEGAARPPLARRVLVADDNADAADMMGMLLETLGCVVKVTYDGTSALCEAEAFAPEIVLLDIGMPDIAGYEVCRRIRGLRSGGAMTVVAVTGWGQEEDRRRSAMAGFDQHLVKPVSPDALVQLVRDAPKRTM
jgi:CheY-like chemotaxis protein